MAKFLVKTPVADFSGALGGVMFSGGQAVVDEDTHPAELAYCRARYVVEPYTETATADDTAQSDVDSMPRKSASKADWVAYATAHGIADDEADTLTRDQLAELFHNPQGGGQ
jgi:hypothetical protein